MSYLVFARKYRPQTFSEILGQDPIVQTLTNAMQQKRVGQAYLFSGPRGTGKTSTARIFAKGLNCQKGPTATPCLKCSPCQEIASGNSLDVLEIDGASNRGIDQIRSLRELAKFAPSSGPYKVYLIDEVHQITAEGFNALLKILEEPPAHVLFILATTAPHKVPATIVSRCQRYAFKRLPLSVIVEKIKVVAKVEKIKITEEAAVGIAKAASGSLRDAESILDQVTAFTGGKIREEDLRTLLGEIDEEVFVKAIEGIRRQDAVSLLALVAQASQAGTDLVQWGLGFLSFLRNLLVAKVGTGPLGFEELGPESIKRLTDLAEPFSIGELTAIIQEVTSALEWMRRVEEPRIPLEVALVRLGSGGSMVAVSDLLDRLERLGEVVAQSGSRAGTVPPVSSPPSSNKPVPQQATSAAKEPVRSSKEPVGSSKEPVGSSESPPQRAQAAGLNSVRSVWKSLLEQLYDRKASASAYLIAAAPVAMEGGDPPCVVVGFPKGFEFHCEALDHIEIRNLISELLKNLLGAPLRCRFQLVDSLPEIVPAPEGKESESVSLVAGGLAPATESKVSTEQVPGKDSQEPAPQPDASVLPAILKMFEGRVLPGEG